MGKKITKWALLGSFALAIGAGCKNTEMSKRITAKSPLDKHGKHLTKIDKNDSLAIVKNGKKNAEIVIQAGSPPVVEFAAKELQRFIKKSTGAKLKIVKKQTKGIVAIILGDSKAAREAGIKIADLPRDAFIIKKVGNAIYIAGKDAAKKKPEKALKSSVWAQHYQRATLFGVYDFLERFLGVRFYFPGDIGTVVPKHKTLTIPTMDIVEAPDFMQRKVSSYTGGDLPKKLTKKESYAFKNREIYQLRGETEYIPNCHGLSRIGLPYRFAKSNPDYFALLPNGKRDNDMSLPGHRGHLCFANKGLENEIYTDAEYFFTGRKAKERRIKHKYGESWDNSGFQPGYFNIMPQDGHGPNNFCRCPNCWKYYGKNEAGELVWTFIANIANKLKKNGIKGYITAMAYGPYRGVPKINIPENVLVMLAVIGPWGEKAPKYQKKYDQLILDWNKKIAPHKVWLWTYASKYGARNIKGPPNVTPRCIGTFFKRNGPNIAGAFMESGSDQFLFNYLNWYVFFKVGWDNSTDVEALLKEHARKMFGPGAKPMSKFYDKLEKLWIKCLGKTVDTPLGPKGYPPAENIIWENIYSNDTMTELQSFIDQAKKLAANDKDSLARVKFIEKNLYGKLLEARDEYYARKKEVEDLVFEITPSKEEIIIDGKIGNEWKNSPSVNMVAWKEDKALVQTIVYGQWSDKYLYLAIDCKEPKIGNLSYTKRKEDDKLIWKDASVEIFLNPSGDRKTYYQIIVNPAGSVSDQKITIDKDSKKRMDGEWNGEIDAKTTISKDSWQAELKIPVEKLGAKGIQPGSAFVANFCRSRNLKGVTRKENQLYTWSPFLNKGFHQLQRFGSIRFVKKKADSKSVIDNGTFKKLDTKGFPSGWHGPRLPVERKLIQIDKEIFRDGGQSLKMIASPSGKILVTQYLPELKPNSKYLLTYFVKTKDIKNIGGKKGGACVNLMTSHNEWFPINWYTDTIPWTKQGFVIKTDEKVNTKHRSYIRLRIMNATGTVWFDDVRLRKID